MSGIQSPLVSGPAVRDDPPVANDWGMVTRPIGPVTVIIVDAPGTLHNGTETIVSDPAVLVLAANPNRKSAVIQNVGSANVRVGVIGVTATTGVRLVPGADLELTMPNCPVQDIYAVRETAVDSIVVVVEVTP